MSVIKKLEHNTWKKNAFLGINIVLMLVCLFVALSSLGKSIPLPWENNTIWNKINFIDTANKANFDEESTSKYNVVIDNYSKRISVLNNKWEISAQNYVQDSAMPFDFITSESIYGSSIYLSGAVTSENGQTIENEKIVRCSNYGEFKETIFDLKSLNLDSTAAHISDISCENDILYFTLINDKNVAVYKLLLDSKNKNDVFLVFEVNFNEQILYSTYSSKFNTVAALDGNCNIYIDDINTNNFRSININNHISNSVKFNKDGNLIFHDIAENKFYVYDLTSNLMKQEIFNFDIKNNFNEVSENLNNYLDKNGYVLNVGTDANYSFWRYVSILLKWFSYLYILVWIVVWIIVFINNQRKNLKQGLVKSSIVICLFFVILISLVCAYSFFMYQNSLDYNYSQTKMMACATSKSINNDAKQEISNCVNDKNITSSSLDKTNHIIDKIEELSNILKNSSNEADIDVSYSVYLYDLSNDVFYCIPKNADNSIFYNCIVLDADTSSILKKQDITQNTSEDIFGKYLYSTAQIKGQNNELFGVVMFLKYSKSLESEFFNHVQLWSLTLIALVLILVVFIKEAGFILAQLEKFKKIRKKKRKKAFIYLVRPLSFLLSLALSADAVLIALISKELFAQCSISQLSEGLNISNILIGLPITAAGVALVFGILLFDVLQRRFSAKSIFISFSCVLLVGMYFTSYACSITSFWMFCITKIFIGLCFGVLQAELYSMAILEKNEDSRHSLVSSISRTKMPASIISALVCAYIAEKFSYNIIYIFAAVSIFLLLIFAIFVFPKKTYLVNAEAIEGVGIKRSAKYFSSHVFKSFHLDSINSEIYKTNKKSKESSSKKFVEMPKLSSKTIRRWLFSPQMLVFIIFLILPYTAAQGYKSFLFPIYSSDLGLDKTTISVIYSLATAFGFLAVLPMSNLINKYDRRIRVIISLFALGFIFILFIANSRLIWAIAVMFLTISILKLMGTASRMLWMRHAKYYKLDIVQLQPTMFLIEEVFKSMQVVFFSTLMFLGGKYTAVFFGIYCIISAIIFGIISKHSPMNLNWQEKDKK